MGAGIGVGAGVEAGALLALPALPEPIFGVSPQPDNSNAAPARARTAVQVTRRAEINEEGVVILVD